MQNKKTSKYSKMIKLQDKLVITTPSSGFDQIDEPLPIKPSDSDFDLIFDLQALPSQPLAIPNSITSSLSRTPMDSTSPKPEWDAIDFAKNQQTKC